MRPPLEEDMARWEEGERSLDEVEARHPDADVRALASLHTRLTRIREEPTPPPDLGWEALRERLPVLIPDSPTRVRRLVSRPLVAAAAALLLAAGAAYAAAPDAINEGLGELWRGIEAIFHGKDDPPENTVPTLPPSGTHYDRLGSIPGRTRDAGEWDAERDDDTEKEHRGEDRDASEGPEASEDDEEDPEGAEADDEGSDPDEVDDRRSDERDSRDD